MAITGTFAADFSNFATAVDNAEVKLRSFQDGSTKVEAALSRMTDSFSGRKLIQDATEMVAAIEKIGGASKLTEQELAKVGKTVEDASAKMRAMGVEVPAGFSKITEASSHTTESMGFMSEAAGTITTAFAGAFTAEAIFEGIKKIGESIIEVTRSVLEYSITLRNLSLQTGIGIADLQVLGAAVKDFGVESDQLGKAIFQLGRRIAGNDESAANAFHLLGLSIKDFKTTAPEEVFLQVERRMASMGNSFQTATASSELFGARLGASLIAASYNLDTTIDEIKKTNTIMSEDAVHAAAEFSESLDHLKLSLLAMAGNALEPALEKLDRFVTNLSSAKGRADDLKLALIALAGAGPASAIGLLFSEGIAKARQISPADAERNATGPAGDPQAFMLALRTDALQALDDEQVRNLAQLKEMGQLTEKNAAGIGVSAGQFKQYEERLKAATAATTELKKSQAEFDATALAGYEKRIAMLASAEAATKSAYSFTGQIANLQQLDLAEQALSRSVFNSLTSVKDRAKVVEETVQRHLVLLEQEAALQVKQAGVTNAAITAELHARLENQAVMGREADGSLKVASASETYRLALHDINNLKVEGYPITEQLLKAEREYVAALNAEAAAANQVLVVGNAVRASIDSTAQSFAGLTVNIAATNDQMSAFYATLANHDNVGTPGANNIGTPSGGVGNLASAAAASVATLNRVPRFAEGGPTAAGLAVLHDNEYVVPSGGALVRGGGGGSPTVNITMTGLLLSTDPAARQQLMALINQSVKDTWRLSGTRLPTGA